MPFLVVGQVTQSLQVREHLLKIIGVNTITSLVGTESDGFYLST